MNYILILAITNVSVGSFIILFGLNLTIQTLYYLLRGVIVPIPPHTPNITRKEWKELSTKNLSVKKKGGK